jgi:peroxiredoxin
VRKKILFTLFLFVGSIFEAKLQSPCDTGVQAPLFTAVTLQGDTLSLASYRGDIVLLDFWASWNIPSRKHNLSTKKIFEKYRAISLRKKRKFVVIQVSLDTRRDLLATAISKDNLYWKTQICDYRGWYSPYASLFNVMRVPSNFLIDTAGVIIAKDVWENTLDEALQKQMQ